MVIAASQKLYTLSAGTPQLTIRLKAENKVSENTGKYLVAFSGAHLEQMPDGAYEVYLSNKEVAVNITTSSSPYFTGVIDTYMLHSGTASQSIFLDVSEKINDKVVNIEPETIITIIFRGNLGTNGSASADAGRLLLTRVSLLKIN